MNSIEKELQKIKFIKAKKIDLKELSKIYIQEMNESFPKEKWSEKNALKHIKKLFSLNPNLCFSIKLKKKLIGFIFCSNFFWWDGKHLRIEEFAIKKEFQRKKIGTQALNFLIEKFNKNYIEINLLTSNSIKHTIFYEKNGFKKDGLIQMSKKLIKEKTKHAKKNNEKMLKKNKH